MCCLVKGNALRLEHFVKLVKLSHPDQINKNLFEQGETRQSLILPDIYQQAKRLKINSIQIENSARMARLKRSTLTRSLRKKLQLITVCSPYQNRSTITCQSKRRDDTTMPSRKFSVNSHNLVYSQKTPGSSSNEAICHRTASVYQIGELYTALNELIHSSPGGRDRTIRNSLVRTNSLWSSENNLLENKKTLSPRESLEPHLRPARSASCLSSKSCYAAISAKTANDTTSVACTNADTTKNVGIYSKIVAKLRGKRLGEQSKPNEHRRAISERQARNGCSKIYTIDDLLEMTKLKANGKSNSKDKRRKGKALARKKAHSFDSCETVTQTICVHEVSSKLKSWYTRAASYAASMEEDRSRAGSSCMGSTENCFESSGYGSKGDACNFEQKENVEHIVGDFDASSNDALNEPKIKDIANRIVLTKSCPVTKLERRAHSDLTSKMSPFSFDKSHDTSKSSDDVFDNEQVSGTKVLSHKLWSSETKCELIRRLSLDIVEDVLAGKSANRAHNGSCHLSRDLSKRKVQQWLKNLHADGRRKDSVEYKESCGVISTTDAIDAKIVSEEIGQPSPVSKTLNKWAASEEVEEYSTLSGERGLSADALFYIPNIEQTEKTISVNMLLNF